MNADKDVPAPEAPAAAEPAESAPLSPGDDGPAAAAAVQAEPRPEPPASPPPPQPQQQQLEEDVSEPSEDEAGDEDGGKETVPLLERPAQTSGRRERKAVQRFVQQSREESKRGAHVLEEGRGTPLSDCPVIMHNIATGRPDDVRVLHQIIFSRPGRPYEFRRNLRLFRGFAFAADSPSFVKKRENLEKYRLDVLRSLSRILDLDRKSGTREELALAILRFLCDPKPSGREVKKKRKRKSKGKAGPGVKKPRKKKAAEGDEAGDDVGSGSESGSDDDDDDDDVGGAGDAEEPKKVIKKKKEPSPKKAPAKSTPAKKAAVKAGVKKTPKKRKAQEAGAEPAGSSSEDDEPLQKKPKAGKPPTNGEIRTLVSKLLHGANLEEVTMKNILTKVYAKYPQHDLTARKDFIKATVKSLIS